MSQDLIKEVLKLAYDLVAPAVELSCYFGNETRACMIYKPKCHQIPAGKLRLLAVSRGEVKVA